MSNTIDVVAAVLDRQELELIKADGSTVRLKQGDVRIRPILAQVTEAVRTGNIPVTIELRAVDNTFTEFEEKTGGVVKLFRVAASKLKKFFGFGKSGHEVEQPLADQVIGEIPKTDEPVSEVLSADAKQDAALEEIMSQAIPASDNSFVQTDVEASREEETVVIAVVDGKGIVPNADALAAQMRHSIKGSTAGIENFLRRCAAVAATRSHSIEDLMKFMHRGDLPVTDAGDIVAYKVLRRANNRMDIDDAQLYVDCHSGKVKQKVGSRVFMAEHLVDHNRNRECSNGLHVARRQYVRGFSGDVLTIIVVRPEDVIAVPQYDANKMRVCGYHIVFELAREDYQAICADRPLATDSGKAALARVLKGDTIGVIQTVEITEGYGGGLKITDLVDARVAKEVIEDTNTAEVTPETELADSVDIADPEEVVDEPVDAKEVAAQAVEAKATGTRAEQAKVLYDRWAKAAQEGDDAAAVAARAELQSFKKSAKVGWEKLGIPVNAQGNPSFLPEKVKVVTEVPAAAIAAVVIPKPLIDPTPRAPEPTKQKRLTGKQKKKAAAKAAYAKRSKPAVAKPAAPAQAAPVSLPVVSVPTPKAEAPKASRGGPSAQIRELLDEADGSMTAFIANEIVKIKKASKKSWEKLSVSEAEAKDILDNAK